MSMNGMSGEDAYILGMDYADERMEQVGGVTIDDENINPNATWSSEKIARDYSTKEYVAEQISNTVHIVKEIVDEIPLAENAKENVIYMVKDDTVTSGDVYKEYQLINGAVVQTGDTSIDLSGYAKLEDVENKTEIDDAVTSTETTWSSKKITSELGSKTYTSLTELGLTAGATFQDAVDALPKGGSALLGVTEFTNYQTIFPYEEGNDQFARVYIVKGAADGSRMYARWFRKDGVKEAIAKFSINNNKFDGWRMLKDQQTYTSLSSLGLTADATIEDVVNALKNGESFLAPVNTFTNYETIFPNRIPSDQWNKIHIIKGTSLPNSHIRCFSQSGACEYLANINNTNVVGWNDVSGTYIDISDSIIEKLGTEILKYPVGKYRINSTATGNKFTDLPSNEMKSGLIEINGTAVGKSPFTDAWVYRMYKFETLTGSLIYTRRLNSGATAGQIELDTGWCLKQNIYTSLKELGLDTTATLNDIVDAMKDGSQFTYKTDVFDYAKEYNNIQYGTVTIHKQSTGRAQVLMTDKNTGNLYVGRMDNTNKFVGWSSETFHRVVAQATAGYFKFKPTNDGGFDQPLRISVTDNYGGMINISGAKPSSSQYKPFKCIRLSYGEYSNYDAMKLANNKMLKLFYYDGYFYLKVTTYTTCTFTGVLEAPVYVATFDETNAEEIPIRSVFDTPYNDGYADPSIIVIGDTDSSDGIIKTLSTLGFTSDIMTWDTGVYRLSHVGGLTNLPAEITEEKPGLRVEHYDVKKWGNNHNPNVSTYGCRQSVLHYKGNVYVRYTESGATAGVLITDTGWQKLAKVYTTLAELGLDANATITNVIKALPVGGKAIISTHEFTNYQTLFPYSVEADQYAILNVEKGYDAAGSRTIVTWSRKDASRIAYGGLDSTNTVKWWNEVSINGMGSKALITNAQNFKLDITKKNANYYGFFKLAYLYGYHLCEICVGITNSLAYTVTKGKNLIDKITYTTNGANIVLGIDFTTKVYGVQVVEMPTDFGRINSLTAESFAGSTVANQTGLDLELYKQTKVITSLDKGTWQVGQRIKQKTDFTANTNDANFEFVAKNESSSGVKMQKMTVYQLTPIENGTNASTSYSVYENGKAQVTVWPATENMPRNDYNIVSEGYLNSKIPTFTLSGTTLTITTK